MECDGLWKTWLELEDGDAVGRSALLLLADGINNHQQDFGQYVIDVWTT